MALVNQLELLANVKEGLQSYKFVDFSDRGTDQPGGVLDLTTDILNAALEEVWHKQPIEVLPLNPQLGVYELELVMCCPLTDQTCHD